MFLCARSPCWAVESRSTCPEGRRAGPSSGRKNNRKGEEAMFVPEFKFCAKSTLASHITEDAVDMVISLPSRTFSRAATWAIASCFKGWAWH